MYSTSLYTAAKHIHYRVTSLPEAEAPPTPAIVYPLT